MNYIALLFTFIVGLSMLVGSLIAVLFKDNDKIVSFSIGTAFSLMTILIALDLLPEILTEFGAAENLFQSISILLIFVMLGALALKYLDHFIPHHHGDHCHDEHEEENHLFHIGLMTLLAISLHNILEGMAIYSVFNESSQSGLLLGAGITLHNIPLGMTVTAALYKAKHSVKKSLIYVLIMAVAALVGGLLMGLFSITTLGDASSFGPLVSQMLLATTAGMIVYIVLFEFLPLVLEKIKEKAMIYGLLVGIIIAILSSL